MKRTALLSALIVMVAGVACLLLLEILMIVLEPYVFTGFYQYDAELGFRVRPNALGTNRFGFNDRDYPLARKPGSFRILSVGDSLGWTGGLEGNYTAILERKLQEHYGDGKVEVINTGYPMTNTAEQLGMLQKYGLQYDPDLVILGFYVGNDFIDADPNRKRLVLNDTFFDIDRRYEHHLFGYPMVPKSRLIQFVKQHYRAWRDTEVAPPEHQPENETSSEGDAEAFTEEVFLNIENGRLKFCNLQRQKNKEFQDNIDYAFESIVRMRDLLRSKGIQFIVAIYPDEFQVDDSLLDNVIDHYGLDREQYEIDLMQKLLSEHLQQERIQYVDLLPTFRKGSKDTRLYLLRNTHWNEKGNKLAADTLFQHLVREGLVKGQ